MCLFNMGGLMASEGLQTVTLEVKDNFISEERSFFVGNTGSA